MSLLPQINTQTRCRISFKALQADTKSSVSWLFNISPWDRAAAYRRAVAWFLIMNRDYLKHTSFLPLMHSLSLFLVFSSPFPPSFLLLPSHSFSSISVGSKRWSEPQGNSHSQPFTPTSSPTAPEHPANDLKKTHWRCLWMTDVLMLEIQLEISEIWSSTCGK